MIIAAVKALVSAIPTVLASFMLFADVPQFTRNGILIMMQSKRIIYCIGRGIYGDDFGGYRHSDTVLVTENGYELLTKFPANMTSMTITNRNLKAKTKGFFARKTFKID